DYYCYSGDGNNWVF
nr:immunoglobulin light chain junction region [Macaca mulatta]